MRLISIFLLFSSIANAGLIELGTSANYRKTTINDTNYSVSESYTGSLAYYLTEATAIEASYTQGFAKQLTDASETRAYFNVYGLDFILTIGGKDSTFRPYIKGGGAYVYKEIYYRQFNMPEPLPVVKSCGIVPSAGAGFRLLLTANFAIKAGAEAQTSPMNDQCLREGETRDTEYDFAAKGGISWLF